MRKIVRKYRISKFRCFMNGLAFGMIAFIALLLCLINMYNPEVTRTAVLLPFGIAFMSLLMGCVSMFRISAF